MKKTITLLLLALLTSVGAWAEEVYTVLYGVAVYTGEKITGVTPQTDFTASDGTTASDVVHSDANGDNCTKAMPIGGSTLYSGTSFTKNFPEAATKGVVHFEANYTATTNGQETWKIVDSKGVEIFGTTDCGYSKGNATKIWGFCNGESLGTNYFRQPRSTHNRVVLDINLSSKVVSYTVLVSSGSNSYTTLTGTYNLPSDVSDVAGLTATKQTYYSYMDNVSLYNVYDDAVTEVPYTINYVYDNNVISTSTGSMAAGTKVEAENPIVIDNVKYFAADGASTSLTLSDDADKNVLNVNLREAENYTYNVYAVNSSDVKLLEAPIATATNIEGEVSTLTWSKYILVDDQWYVTSETTFQTTVSKSGTKNVVFEESDVTYFYEMESLTRSGGVYLTETSAAYSNGSRLRLSKGSTYSTPALSGGTYELTIPWQNGNSSAAEVYVYTGDANGNLSAVLAALEAVGSTINTFTASIAVPEGYSIAFNGNEGSNNNNARMDYMTLKRTGDLKETITVATEGTSTYVTTYPLDFSNIEGLTVLIATGETEGYVELSKVTQVPAGAPIIVKGEAGDYSVPVCDATTYSGGLTNKLEGSATASYTVAADDKIYAIKKDKSEFRPVAADVEIPAKKAYFRSTYPINANAKPFIIRGEEEDPTAVSTVEVVEAAKAKKFFNAAGQQVDENYKGFVITSAGKKIIKK